MSESGRCICAKWVQRGGRRKGKSPQHAGEKEGGREEEDTVWYRGRREVECMGHRVQHSWLHAFRMATGFTVPSQGRRGTAPLNQLCHFYARRLIFVEFYYLQCVCLLLRARALCAYVDARPLLGGCKCVYTFSWKMRDHRKKRAKDERRDRRWDMLYWLTLILVSNYIIVINSAYSIY